METLLEREEDLATLERVVQDAAGGAGRLVLVGGDRRTVGRRFRVESDTARVLVLSTPAGIEDMVRGLAEPARWPWLQPPPDGPRVPAERMAAVESATGMVRW